MNVDDDRKNIRHSMYHNHHINVLAHHVILDVLMGLLIYVLVLNDLDEYLVDELMYAIILQTDIIPMER